MRIAPVAAALLFTALIGCKKPDAEAAAADAAVAPNAVPAASGSAAAPAMKPAGASGKVLDSPPWPAGKSPEIKLTWAVYPTVGQGETSTRNLELVARSGEVARRFPIGAIKGALLPLNQSVCGDKQVAYKKTANEVAKITFYVGGASTFAVRRSSPGMLEVESVQGADGYCPNNDCDTKSLLVKIPIPDDARIVEAISDIEAAGKEAPFDCSKGASSAAVACKAPQVAAYEMETFKPICAVPCKVDANCTSPQTCVTATKSSEPTMGMAAALKNEIHVCAAPKAARPMGSALPRPRSSVK